MSERSPYASRVRRCLLTACDLGGAGVQEHYPQDELHSAYWFCPQ